MPQYHEACVFMRRIVEDLSEAEVQGDEASLLSSTALGDLLVTDAFQRLFGSRRDIVPGLDERLAPAGIRVLVQLEAQLQDAMSIGSTRSRVISAA